MLTTATVINASSRPRRSVGVERVQILAAYSDQQTTCRAPVTPMRSGASDISGPGGLAVVSVMMDQSVKLEEYPAVEP